VDRGVTEQIGANDTRANRTDVGVFEWHRAFREHDNSKPDGMTVAVVAVALAVATFATYSTGADARPSRSRLATVIGLDVSTVGRALKTLCRLGWLRESHRRVGGVVTYQLTVPAPRVSAPPTPGTSEHTPMQGRPGGDAGAPLNVDMTSTGTSTRTSSELSVELSAVASVLSDAEMSAYQSFLETLSVESADAVLLAREEASATPPVLAGASSVAQPSRVAARSAPPSTGDYPMRRRSAAPVTQRPTYRLRYRGID
jgi:hypothetical protein